MSVDWAEAIMRAKANAGEWVLAGATVPTSALQTVRRRGNHAVRDLSHPLEGRMIHIGGTPRRGDLYVRYLGPRERPPVVHGAALRLVKVPPSLRDKLRARAEVTGNTVTELFEQACRQVAKNGARSVKVGELVQVGGRIDQRVWSRAMARAERDGFILSEALRDELAWMLQ